MFGFWIKKTFFDMWDNLLTVVIVNFGFYAVAALILGGLYGASAVSTMLIPAGSVFGTFLANLIVLAFGGALITVYGGAVSFVTRKIADYEKPGFSDFITGLRDTWRPSLVFGLIQGALLALIINAAQIYLAKTDNLLNWLLFFILFWIYLTWLMAAGYFLALQSRYDSKLVKNIRKMFILFFDNTVFSILGLSLISLLVTGLSFFLFFILPGFAGVLLLQATALKLRALKYDYLDAHPQAHRRKIPWSTLLEDDRERVGKRTLKGMFMPWKE
jgi:hypothetical protein